MCVDDFEYQSIAFSDFWRKKGSTGGDSVLGQGAALRDYGYFGGLLPEGNPSFDGKSWAAGVVSGGTGGGSACVEKEYAFEYWAGNRLLYVPCAGYFCVKNYFAGTFYVDRLFFYCK